MHSSKHSIKSQNISLSSIKQQPIQPRTFIPNQNQTASQANIQFENQASTKPKSRFLRPANQLSYQPIESQRQSVANSEIPKPTLNQLTNESQLSELQNANVANKMRSDVYQLQSNRQSKSQLYNKKMDISFQEKLAEIAQTEIKQEEKVVFQQPYQICIFYLPPLNGPLKLSQQIWNVNTFEDIVGEKNMLDHKENEIGQFGVIEQKPIFKQKILYQCQKVSQITPKLVRKDPLILVLQEENQGNYKLISNTLYKELNKILNTIKQNNHIYENQVRELSRYSVISQVKQIVDKTYQKQYDLLAQAQMSMSDNINLINEILLMTEGYEQTFDEKPQSVMLDFIKKLLNQQQIKKTEIIQAIYYAYLIICKQQEIQEEQQLECQQFVVAFNHGADSINLLYEFATCKIQKLQLKLKIAKNKLNQIILPYCQIQKQNDIILQDISNYIFKMKQKKDFILKELIRELFTKEQLEQLDEQYILSTYTQFRNQILRNPNKFNYELIKKKPIFILQEYKLLFHVQARLEELYFQINSLNDIYFIFKQIPIIEETLLSIKEKRDNLKEQFYLMEEQNQFRDTVVKLKNDMDILMTFQNQFTNLNTDLPYALQRLKDWITTEVQQSLNFLRIVNSKLHSIDILANQINEQQAQQLIEESQILQTQIHNLIDTEIPPQYFIAKQIRLSIDLQNAINEIYQKYLFFKNEEDQGEQQPQELAKEQPKDTSQQLKQLQFSSQQSVQLNTYIEKCNQKLQILSKARDSLLIQKSTQQIISQLYITLTELTVQYQVWEHMNATRYLMTHIQLQEAIVRIHKHDKDKMNIQIALKKMKEQMSYFEMNSHLQSSVYFRQHLKDGITFLTYFKDTYEEYRKLAEKNVKNPGSVTIDPLMQTIQNNLNSFFKIKTNTLLQYKEIFQKVLQSFIEETKIEFEDSEKAAELDGKFQQSETTILECDEMLTIANQRLEDIYQLGVEAVKQDANRQKKQMTIDAYRLNLGFDAQIVQLKEKVATTYAEFINYKEKLQLNSLPLYKQKLEQKLQEFKSLEITLKVFEKTIDAVYYNCLELINVLAEVQGKIENMLTMGNSQFIIDTLSAFKQKEVESLNEIKSEYGQIKLQNNIENIINVTIELQQYIVDIFDNIIQIIINFSEIYNGFQYFQDMINLLNEDFFKFVYRWLTFFQGKQSDRTLIFADAAVVCENKISKLEKQPLLRLPCFKLFDSLNKIVHSYETDFNPDFMLILSDFGQQYHTQGNKVQNFAEFQNELKFLLTPENNKEDVRKALVKFYEKNKSAEVPLSRMTQFLRSVQTIQKDDRMKSQKRLRRLQNIEEILSQMGSGQMDYWIQVCKNMTNSLELYFKHAESADKLQPFVNYTDKIEEQSRSLSNVELKNFVTKFIEMLRLDYNLSKF